MIINYIKRIIGIIMDAQSFVDLCMGKTAKARKRKKRKIGFAADAFVSSLPGGRLAMPCPGPQPGPQPGPEPGPAIAPASAPAPAPVAGESVNPLTHYQAFLEGLSKQYPNSNVVEQIKKMFENIKNNDFAPLYCSADGTSTHA